MEKEKKNQTLRKWLIISLIFIAFNVFLIFYFSDGKKIQRPDFKDLHINNSGKYPK